MRPRFAPITRCVPVSPHRPRFAPRDGHTASGDPNATEVDPSTWRLVTISTSDGDWQVQVLEPESWIEANHLSTGSAVDLSKVTNLEEMGVPGGLTATVDSITACPPIETGNGRVVLATVSHFNNEVYDLRLTDATGQSETIGVTGHHKIYTEDRGWVEASQLVFGEQVRGNQGTLTVTGLNRETESQRVYNMTVEADHDYFVGDVSALAHNICVGDPFPPGFLGSDTIGLLRNYLDQAEYLIDEVAKLGQLSGPIPALAEAEEALVETKIAIEILLKILGKSAGLN